MFDRYYVVLDTNVIVSTLLNRFSIPGMIVSYCLDGFLVPVLNKEIYQEYRMVLYRPKFLFSRDNIENFLAGLTQQALFIEEEPLNIKMIDDDDRKFYEVLSTQQKIAKTFLVTGNTRHYPTEPCIVTPRQMMDLLQEALE